MTTADETTTAVHCPICQTAAQPAGEKTGKLAQRVFHFHHCPSCHFSFISDPWTDYAKIYDNRYYRGEGADPYVDYFFELDHPDKTIRRYEWDGIITAVRSLIPLNKSTRWLDFGCGNGGQVRHVTAEIGCDIAGTDTGEIVTAARAKGIRIFDESELSAWDGTCDVVTAIEVLEHLTDPLPALRRIRALLKPGGLFFYTTGNAKPFRGNLTAWGYTIPEIHVSFYEPDAMVHALKATGFRPDFRPDLPGLDPIVRFKVLKQLGLHRWSPLFNLIPWAPITAHLRRKLGIGGLPLAWAE